MDKAEFLDAFTRACFISQKEDGVYTIYFPLEVEGVGYVGALHFVNEILTRESIMIVIPEEKNLSIISYDTAKNNNAISVYEEILATVNKEYDRIYTAIINNRKTHQFISFEIDNNIRYLKLRGYVCLEKVKSTVMM